MFCKPRHWTQYVVLKMYVLDINFMFNLLLNLRIYEWFYLSKLGFGLNLYIQFVKSILSSREKVMGFHCRTKIHVSVTLHTKCHAGSRELYNCFGAPVLFTSVLCVQCVLSTPTITKKIVRDIHQFYGFYHNIMSLVRS